MFFGHYAASLAAKAVEPRAPLWSYVIAAQAIDIGWAALLMAGVEKARIDPSLPGSTLDRKLELHGRKGFDNLWRKVRKLAQINRLRHAAL